MEPLTPIERSIVAKLGTARFPPATASKRFAQDLCSGHIQQLSERGRAFLAFVAHRFRRQYELTAEEWGWVNAHLKAATPRSDADYNASLPDWPKTKGTTDETPQESEPVRQDVAGTANLFSEKTTGES